MLKDKRGFEITAENLIGMVLAFLIIIIIAPKAFGFANAFLSGSSDKMSQAQSQIEDLILELASMKNSEITYMLTTPYDWFLVKFDKNNPDIPEECAGKNCLCICPAKKIIGGFNCDKGACKAVEKEIKIEGRLKIPSDITIKVNDAVEITLKEAVKTEISKADSMTKPGISVTQKSGLVYCARSKDAVIDSVVLHHTGGSTIESAYNTLKLKGYSVHYMIDRDGKIYQYVDEKKEAIHAQGFNDESIGIEIVNSGLPDMPYTEEQYISIKLLIEDIAKRNTNIKYDNEHVIGHFQVEASTGSCRKWDPSPNFDWAKINLPEHMTSAEKCSQNVASAGYAGETGALA